MTPITQNFMKTPIEKAIDELLDIRQEYFSENKVATDTLDGILKILTGYLDEEKSELLGAWKTGYSYGSSGGGVITANSWYLHRYKPE